MSDEPPKRDHCFHHDGTGIQRGWTTFWNETCCQCGEKRGMVRLSEGEPGHGPHVNVTRSVTSVTEPQKSEYCTPTPRPPSPTFMGATIIAGVGGGGSAGIVLGGSSS